MRSLLYLIGIFLIYYFGPDLFSVLFFGMWADEGMLRYAGLGFYYVGRDFDFWLEGLAFLAPNSIWYLMPMSTVLPLIVDLLLIGLFQIVGFFLLKEYRVTDLYKPLSGTREVVPSFYSSLRWGTLVSIICGIGLFFVVIIYYALTQKDFLLQEFVVGNRQNFLLARHPLYSCAYIVVGCLGAAVFEEYFFRRVFFKQMRQAMHFVPAAMLNSILFASLHFGDPIIFAQTFICGFLACLIYEKTEHIVGCVVFHFVGNIFIFILPWWYPISVIG